MPRALLAQLSPKEEVALRKIAQGIERQTEIHAEEVSGPMLRSLREHLTIPGAAAIVGTKGEWEHWTVVMRMTAARLYLLDSEGDTSMASKRGKRRLRYHAGLIDPTCLFLLKLHAQSRGGRR